LIETLILFNEVLAFICPLMNYILDICIYSIFIYWGWDNCNTIVSNICYYCI